MSEVKTAATGLEKVSETVKVIATTIESQLTVGDAGVVTAPDSLYEATLPADLPLDTVKRVQAHTVDFANGLTLAMGNLGLKTFEGDKDAAQISTKVKAGHDHISTEVLRSKEVRNPSTGVAMTKYGSVSTKHVSGIGASRGDYKRIQDDVSSRHTAIFSA